MSRTMLAAALTAATLAISGFVSPVVAHAQARRPAPRKPAPKPAAPRPPTGAAAQAAAIAQIEKTGGRVGPIAQNDDRLEVSFRLLGPSVTDASLAPLRALTKVVRLDLGQTGVTDAGLVNLKGLATLTDLHLEGTKVTDRGLTQIKDLKNLTYLNVYGTGITDAGLDQLAGLANLKHLYVWQTKVTQAGADKLKKALPQVDVVMGWDATAPPKEAAPPPKP